MSVIFGMVIAQITKIFKVGFEVMDAFDLFSLVTSLKMFEKLKGDDFLSWMFREVACEWRGRRRRRRRVNENREKALL